MERVLKTAAIGLCLIALLWAPGCKRAPRESKTAGVPALSGKPKNTIILIADGWGYNHVAASSLYEHGDTGRLVYESFPVRLGMSTCPLDVTYDPQRAWSEFDYVNEGATDSAAAATQMATGVRTHNGAIGVGPDGQRVVNVGERAEQLGRATGVITTVMISHATPAGFGAHSENRDNCEQIAREMVGDSRLDVIMGAGHPWYDENGACVAATGEDGAITTAAGYEHVGGVDTWLQLLTGSVGGDADGDGIADAWRLVQTRSQFQSLITGPTPRRVIGVAQVRETLAQGRAGDANAAPFAVPRDENMPTLAEMTWGALNVLDEDPDGFVLMIEGGAVDWASHANQTGRMLEEMTDFNRAVEAVIEWVERESSWGETLVIVTGDHECGYLTGPGSNPDWKPVVNNGKGKVPGVEWHSGGHTNSLIPLFAKGAGAETLQTFADETDPRRGSYIHNTELAKALFALMK
ncbi:MAG: alkaline phosphatase [Verrucomicrobia bacterium]|nr:alkaline phosphatase [Verrucomicrobiota bacterium]